MAIVAIDFLLLDVATTWFRSMSFLGDIIDGDQRKTRVAYTFYSFSMAIANIFWHTMDTQITPDKNNNEGTASWYSCYSELGIAFKGLLKSMWILLLITAVN